MERKASLANPKHQCHIPQCEEHDCCANKKKNGDCYGYQVCLISWINIDYKRNSGEKSLSYKSEAQYCLSQLGEHHCNANNKKNGNYYEYLNLSHFMNEL